MIGTGGLALILATCFIGAQNPKADSDEPETGSLGIARRGTATVEDAYRVFAEMAEGHGRLKPSGDVANLSFQDITAELESIGVVDPDWGYSANSCLRRDVLAYMSCSYLGWRPGLLTGVCGMTRRYAHREMLYRGIIPPGAPGTLVSGSEVLSVATRVSRRVRPQSGVQLTPDEIH